MTTDEPGSDTRCDFGLTLLGIALYSFFAVAGNLLRGLQSEHAAFART